MRLIDSHCHFDDPRLDEDRDGAWQRALAVGVDTMVVPGVTAAAWPHQRAVVSRYRGLHAAYGLHPMFMAEHRPGHIDLLRQWLQNERPVAVGECGLDYFIPDPEPQRQSVLFEAQLRLAREFDLPVVIHARRAVDDVISHLKRFPGLSGEIHSFAGSRQQADILIDMGFLLGFGGPVTYPRAQRLRGLVATLPETVILLETDAPDQAGASHRGELNEPAYLPEILTTVAELRAMSPQALAQAVNRNAMRLYALQ